MIKVSPKTNLTETVLSQNKRYYTRLAQSEEDLLEVFKLRYKVFVEELKEGLENDEKLEKDPFDKYCDFILLVEKNTEKIVGLYRILPYFKMNPKIGYYSNIEFDLSPLIQSEKYRDKIAELGRLAIAKEHRGGTNLLALWGGLVKYAKIHGIRYLIGCGSLSKDVGKPAVISLYKKLRKKNVFRKDLLIFPRKPSEIRELSKIVLQKEPNPLLSNVSDDLINYDAALLPTSVPPAKLPGLIKRYLAVGARFLGPPAFDSYDFGCYDFLIMIDLNSLKARLSYFYVRLKLLLDRL